MTTDTLEFPPVDTAALDNAKAKAEFMAAQQLAIIETGVAELTPTARALAELEHRLKGIAYPSLNTGAGMQAAIDDRRTLIDLRVGLGKLVDAANKKDRADTKARCDKRDIGCLRLTTAIKALEEPIDQQIKAEEERKAEEKRKRDAAEAERKAKHESGINRIRAYAVKASEPDMTAARIHAGIQMLEAMPTPTAEAWEEFAVPAASAICETLEKMRALHAKALADEAAAAEAERVRVENERRAAELAEKERKLAEQEARLAELQRQQEAVAAKPAEPPDASIAAGQQITMAAIERGAALIDATSSRVERAAGSPELAAALDHIAGLTDLAPVIRTPGGPITMIEPAQAKADPDEKPTLKLGDINDWLGGAVTTSAAGLLLLGINHSGTDKAAKLYKPSDKARIREALIQHLQGLC